MVKNRASWETDVNFSSSTGMEIAETKAFVEEMIDKWIERRKIQPQPQGDRNKNGSDSLYSLENMEKDYKLKKQRIHRGWWTMEIEKQQEEVMNAMLGNSSPDENDWSNKKSIIMELILLLVIEIKMEVIHFIIMKQ